MRSFIRRVVGRVVGRGFGRGYGRVFGRVSLWRGAVLLGWPKASGVRRSIRVTKVRVTKARRATQPATLRGTPALRGTLRGARVRRIGAASALLLTALTLAACAPVDSSPAPTQSETGAPAPTPTPTATPTPDPELVPGGTAGQNRPYFTFVLSTLVQASPQPASLEIVDTLVAAGFERAAMSITPEKTRVGDPADSILVAVIVSGQCLLGQVAQETVTTELADLLGTGKCLVGRTLSLD
jgi:hypothetical protein